MLGNKAIWDAIQEGTIVIRDYNKDQLGPNSYDVRVGQYVWRQRFPTGGSSVVSQFLRTAIHLADKEQMRELWAEDVEDNGLGGTINIDPGELVLAHTQEFVGCYRDIVAQMSSRSTMMRCGIAVCVDAGLGDVGYDNRWTMELYNHTDTPIVIPVGARIAQMTFHRVEGVNKFYEEKGGYYGLSDWTPDDMLPRSNVM